VKARTKAREAWIKRYTGYFGEPLMLPEYRRGQITFEELRSKARSTAEDMASEAMYCDPVAHDYDEPATPPPAPATRGGN